MMGTRYGTNIERFWWIQMGILKRALDSTKEGLGSIRPLGYTKPIEGLKTALL